ncbi:hypothetical protein ACTJJ0_15135 [Chitinophaga sp. 22321]|uniref:Collagen triple helix repeat-containing protein n=1 Tax=Chitinophaga hostae TaxID=2831022 RepID=A0ABS5J229_9BACT|nr:hypothetical protein [Chitinophaga hostae]MBS0029283.1 hypothetical protein [Chitinophaga hostae]
MKTTLLLLAGLLMISCFACSKTGPEGPQGAQGPKGDKGATGNQGNTGTANVIYSPWKSFKGLVAQWPIPALTRELLDKGVTLVYADFGSTVLLLPYASNAGDIKMYPQFYVGGLNVVSNYPLDVIKLRYVIIPGGIAGRRASGADFSDYQAMCGYYHIQP